jgi:hypothetical protein
MKQARIRLIVAAVAFAAWIGWLVYLAVPYMGGPPVILSRPQFLNCQVAVVARVEGKDQPVTVLEVRDGDPDVVNEKDKIVVDNLDRSLKKPPVAPAAKGENKDPGEWETPGEFIIPLVNVIRKGDQVHASVAELPETHSIPPGTPRIYPKTPQTLDQFHALPKPRGS